MNVTQLTARARRRRSRRRRTRQQRRAITPRWAWIIPVALFFAITTGLFLGLSLMRDVGIALGAVALIAAVRRPVVALQVLLGVIGVHLYLMAFLYRSGVPGGLVNNIALYKELIAVAVVICGVRNLAKPGRSLDALDWFCIAYVAISLVYAFAPGFVGANGFVGSATAPLSTSDRLIFWRTDIIGILLVFGCRHLELTRDDLGRLIRAVLVSAGLVATSGIVEFVSSSAWNTFAVNTIGVTRYQTQVLHAPVNPTSVLVFGTGAFAGIVRVGGTLDYLTVGAYLTIAAAVLLHWTSARRVPRYTYPLMVACGVVVIASQSRTGMIALVVAALVTIWSTTARPERLKLRLALVFVLGTIVLGPFLIGTAAFSRVLGRDTASDTVHRNSFRNGVAAIAQQPLGYGLGTSAGGQRFQAQVLTTENQYLQYGVEMGVVEMGLFIAICVTLIIRLRRSSRDFPDDADTPGVTAAVVGVFVSAFFLHVLVEQAVSVTLFGLAGVCLGANETRRLANWQSAASAQPPTATVPAS